MHAAYDRQPVLSPHRPFSRTSAPHPVTYGRPLVADIGASQRHPVSLRPRVPRQALPRPRFSRGFPRGLGSLPPSQSPPLTSLGAPSPRESVTDLSQKKKKKTTSRSAAAGARPWPGSVDMAVDGDAGAGAMVGGGPRGENRQKPTRPTGAVSVTAPPAFLSLPASRMGLAGATGVESPPSPPHPLLLGRILSPPWLGSALRACSPRVCGSGAGGYGRPVVLRAPRCRRGPRARRGCGVACSV